MYEVTGVDLSSWNGTMDFSVTKTKCQYAYIRVGFNNYGKDVRCDYNRQAAIANDFPYGVYWYVKPGLDWRQHADNFARIAAEYPIQLDMVLDVETTMLNQVDTLNWLINLDSRIESLTGRTPMIYTSMGFWNGCVAPNAHFARNRLWVASWTTGPAPSMPAGWSKWTHWQWSADGNKKGAEYGSGPDGDPDMDLNRYCGTAAEFDKLYGTHISDPNQLPSKVRVTANVLNVRATPGGTLVGYVPFGTIFGVTGQANDNTGKRWWKVGSAYIASWYTEIVE